MQSGRCLPLPSYSIIGRERSSSGDTEATYKLRGPEPVPEVIKQWKCPLTGASEEKREIDVTWTGEEAPKRSYSFSCTAEKVRLAKAVTRYLSVESKGCLNKMERHKADGLKVERWVLAQGVVVIEVSMGGEDTPQDLARFESQVVKPLRQLKVIPLKGSKTELGSQCKRSKA